MLAGSLALAACTSTGEATPVEDPPDAAPPSTDDGGPSDGHEEPDPVEPTDEEAVALAYGAFLDALTTAMEAGDPDLTVLAEHAEGAGLVSAPAMVVSLTETGRVARGELVPSLESIEVNGDSATVEPLLSQTATGPRRAAARNQVSPQSRATGRYRAIPSRPSGR